MSERAARRLSGFARRSSEQAARSTRTIRRFRSTNRLPLNRCFDLISGQQLERGPKFIDQFFLALFDESAGREDQAPFQIAPDQQLFDEKSPAMVALPAPGSLANKNLSGWRDSVSP